MIVHAQQHRNRGARRRGFTMAEAVVTTFLTVLLGMLMAMTVATFARPSADIDHRARLALEANLIAESLAYDLGDYLLDAGGSAGTLDSQAMRPSGCNSAASPPSYGAENDLLRLSFTTPGVQTPTLVDYFRQDTHLVRRVSGASSSETVVAGHVADFKAYPCDADGAVSALGSYSRIVLMLASDPDDPDAQRKGNCAATYVLIAVPPP